MLKYSKIAVCQPISYFLYFLQALENLRKISDGSLEGIEFPNSDPLNQIQVDIKKEDLTDYEVPTTGYLIAKGKK